MLHYVFNFTYRTSVLLGTHTLEHQLLLHNDFYRQVTAIAFAHTCNEDIQDHRQELHHQMKTWKTTGESYSHGFVLPLMFSDGKDEQFSFTIQLFMLHFYTVVQIQQ